MDVKQEDDLAGNQSGPPTPPPAPADGPEPLPAAPNLQAESEDSSQPPTGASAATSNAPVPNGHHTQSPRDPATDIPVLATSAPLDPALDEDAPHEDDDDGTENGSPFMSLTSQMARDSSVASSQPALAASPASFTPASEARPGGSCPPPPDHEADHKPVIPALARIAGPKRKRSSSERIGTPKKAPNRVKPPEQIAAEALIEQQNPNATKNELRSLKLRALHAGRIEERERNMSIEEKTRRQRLREYVRQKRAEERIQKSQAMSKLNASAGGDQSLSFSMDVDTSFNSTTTGADYRMFELPSQPSGGNVGESGGGDANQASDPNDVKPSTGLAQSEAELESGREVRQRTKSQPTPTSIPDWRDPKLQTATAATNPSSTLDATSQAPKPKRRRASAGNNGEPKPSRRKSTSRVKTPEQASLEALIEKQNPNASKTQLKSLKLRALHAGRIAEREQNMSEKEKARRQKLREYMRRRRDEERNHPPGTMPTVVGGSAVGGMSSTQASSSNVNQERQADGGGSSMSGLGGQGSVSTELNAADRLAAFSIMELNNNFQHQFGQTHESMGGPPQPNMHLHPLFQMPMAQSSVQVMGPQYNCTMHPAYGIGDGWGGMEGQQEEMGGMTAEEAAQKALHAALEEAMYMKPHPEALEGAEQQGPADAERMAQLEEERIRIAEEEILGVARMADAEMALIAAAAAEVERAHQIAGGSSSVGGGM